MGLQADILAQLQAEFPVPSNLSPSQTTAFNAGQTNLALAFATALAPYVVPVGGVVPFAGSSAPSGFLLCDGSAVSRTTYAALFAVVGIFHGQGDGSSTFNLPDYRGRFLRGKDGGAANDPDRAARTAMATGGNTGDNVGSVQADDFKSHTHQAPNPGSTYIYGSSTGVAAAPAGTGSSIWGDSTATGTPVTGMVNGNESRPKNANVNYVIKT